MTCGLHAAMSPHRLLRLLRQRNIPSGARLSSGLVCTEAEHKLLCDAGCGIFFSSDIVAPNHHPGLKLVKCSSMSSSS